MEQEELQVDGRGILTFGLCLEFGNLKWIVVILFV